MAKNPYTQDVTKSTAYRQVTGQDKDKLSQVLEGAVVLKTAYNNNVASNIEALQDSKVIEIQKKKLMLKSLNGVSLIQNDIRDNYNNDVGAWSRNYAQKELRNEAISKYGLTESADNLVDLRHPDSAYGDWLNKRAKGIEDNYTKLVNELDSVGVPYKDLTAGSTFVDKVYQSAFNGLERENKFNLINSVGSLFKGHGLGNQSASELKADFNANMAKSSISKLESINNTFKALYLSNPELAKDYEAVIEKADIREKVTQVYGEVTVDKRYDRKTGKTIEHKYREITTNYVDKLGVPRSTTTLQTIEGDNTQIDRTEPATVAGDLIYLRMLEQAGHEDYFNARVNLEPYQAFMAIRPVHGKSFTELESQALRKTLAPDIMTSWKGIEANYILENKLTGEQSYRPDIQRYLDGKGPKPSNYYNNIGEYSKDILGVALGVDPLNDNFISLDKKTVQVVSGLSNSPDWKAFTSNSRQIQEIKDEIGMSLEEEEELLADFEAGIYANVDKDGNFFPSENEQLLRQLYDTKRRVLLDPAQLTAMGLETSMFPRGVRVGYNVKTKTLAFQSVSDDFAFEPIEEEVTDVSNLEKSDKGWATNLLRAVNDIPYLGAVTELALGEDIDVTDALWLIPGLGLVGGGIKVALSQATKYGANAILASSKGSAMLTKITAQYNKTKKVQDTVTKVAKSGPNKGKTIKVKSQTKFKTVPAGEFFGFTSKALYNSWYKGLSAVEKAMVNSINKTGKSIDIKKFSESLGNIRGAEFIARIPGTSRTNITNKTIVKYGTGASVIGQVASRTFDDTDDEPID